MDVESGRFYEEGRKNPFTHCIVYKRNNKDGTGTWDWQRTSPMTKEEAIQGAKSFEETYPFSKALVVNYKQSVNIGLPDHRT